MTPVVSWIFSFWLLTIVAPSVLPLMTTWDDDTNWLPFMVSITPCSTSAKVTVLGESAAISGAGLALPQKGFSVLPQPGRSNKARAASVRRKDIQGSFLNQARMARLTVPLTRPAPAVRGLCLVWVVEPRAQKEVSLPHKKMLPLILSLSTNRLNHRCTDDG
jgi:hypothetical protein